MKEKSSSKRGWQKNSQLRPDELDVRSTKDALLEGFVVECQVVWAERVTEAGSDLTNVFPFTEQCSTTFPSILPKPTKNFTVMSFICKTGVLLAGEYAWMCLPASVYVWERTCVAWVADSITWRTITLACQRPKDLRKISRLNRSSPLSFPSSFQEEVQICFDKIKSILPFL